MYDLPNLAKYPRIDFLPYWTIEQCISHTESIEEFWDLDESLQDKFIEWTIKKLTLAR